MATTFILRFGCVNTIEHLWNSAVAPGLISIRKFAKIARIVFWVSKNKWSSRPQGWCIDINCPSCCRRKTVWNPLVNSLGWARLIQIIQNSKSAKSEHVWTMGHDGCTSSSTHLRQELSTNLAKVLLGWSVFAGLHRLKTCMLAWEPKNKPDLRAPQGYSQTPFGTCTFFGTFFLSGSLEATVSTWRLEAQLL